MRKRNTYTALVMGAALLAVISVTAMAASAVPQKNRTQEGQKITETPKVAVNSSKTVTEVDEEPNVPPLYGSILKIDGEKMEIRTAAVIWQKGEEKDAAQTKNKKNDQEDQTIKVVVDKASEKDADKASEKDIKADFETDTMKWQLDGKTVEVKFEKETKFLKQMSMADAAEETAGRDKKAVDEKDHENAMKNAGKDLQKGDQEELEASTFEEIMAEDLKEGDIVFVNVNEEDSLVAIEVVVLADAKENKA